MDASTVVVPLVSALVSGAATYGALSARTARAEKDIETVTRELKELRERLVVSRESQGERIGAVEDRVSEVKGQCQAILTILGEEVRASTTLAARVRRQTKPPSTSG